VIWRYRKRLRITPARRVRWCRLTSGAGASPIAHAGGAPQSDYRALVFSYTSYDPCRHGSAAPQAAGLQPHQTRRFFLITIAVLAILSISANP
jgi:hypothetical protein